MDARDKRGHDGVVDLTSVTRNLLDLYWPLAEDGAILDAEKKSPARFIVEKRAGAVTHQNPELWRRIQEKKAMNDRTPPSLMEGVKQGIEAAGQALLEESRRTGRPLATCRDGQVVLVDADGRVLPEPLKTNDAH